MNHLAHFHLAGERPGHVVGALLADYLRGPLRGEHPAEVEAGVRLHRRIDAFTDSHPGVRALRGLFDTGERRLAGIVLDVWFDHCLARHWRRFDAREPARFSRSVYALLRANRALLPEAARRHAGRMEAHDLLPRYAEPAVVEGTLERIGARLGMAEPMQRATARAQACHAAIEDGFLAFYPELETMARAFRASAG